MNCDDLRRVRIGTGYCSQQYFQIIYFQDFGETTLRDQIISSEQGQAQHLLTVYFTVMYILYFSCHKIIDKDLLP